MRFQVKQTRRLIATGLPALLALASGKAWASGFSIRAQSASNLGTAGAADTGGSQDITAIFSNPAAIGLFSGQRLNLGVAYIDMDTKFKNGSRSLPLLGGEASQESKSSVQNFSKDGTIPLLYGTHQIHDAVTFGWSLTVPLATNSAYGKDWVGRYHAIDTQLQVLNLDLGASYKILENLYFGAGVQIQHGKGKISGASNLGAVAVVKAGNEADLALRAAALGDTSKLSALTGAAKSFADAYRLAVGSGKTTDEAATLLKQQVRDAAAKADGTSDVIVSYEGEDYAFGYNLGFVYNPFESLSLGLSYRSAVTHKTKGDISFAGQSDAAQAYVDAQGYDDDGQLNLTVPYVLSFGADYSPVKDLNLYVNMSQTGWSSLENLDLNYKNAAGDVQSRTKLDWKDTLYVGLGGAYNIASHYVIRTGVAWDHTPTSAHYRSPRSPDNDRTILALGGGYLGDGWNVDAGLAHTIVKDPTLNLKESDYPEAQGRGDLTGTYAVSANTFMLQYGYQL